MCFFFIQFFSSLTNLFSHIFFFFFNDTATTEIYTLSLHDALPINPPKPPIGTHQPNARRKYGQPRSEEHTSELQSLAYLVCRLLLEKKKTNPQQATGRQHTAGFYTARRNPAHK